MDSVNERLFIKTDNWYSYGNTSVSSVNLLYVQTSKHVKLCLKRLAEQVIFTKDS